MKTILICIALLVPSVPGTAGEPVHSCDGASCSYRQTSTNWRASATPVYKALYEFTVLPGAARCDAGEVGKEGHGVKLPPGTFFK